MIRPRYIVFDDAPENRGLCCTADQFADALRSPLAALGVGVVRQRRAGSASLMAGFQVHGWPRKLYNSKLHTIDEVVDAVTKSLMQKN
jgi:hypothetical protein